MKLKTIFGIILGVVAVGLTSCSSDLTNGENTAVNPNETAKRTLSLSTDNAKTRSEVNLTTGNKWETGDQFFSYNLDLSDQATESPNAILTAKSSGASTLLQGTVACKNGDRLNIFYPGTYVTGYAQGTFPISMQKSLTGNKTQDGTVENLKNFDYSFGTGSVTVNGNSASGNVNMEKLYAILKVDFTFNGTKLTNIKKLVLSNVITGGDFKVQTGQMDNAKIGSIEVNPANPAELLYVAVFPTNSFKPKFEVYTTDNKAYTYTVTASDWETKTAKVYPITVAVKEFTPEPVTPPYIVIGGVKWGKYNLQYSTGTKVNGWVDGYHLAENPWDYYMYTPSKITEPLSTLQMTLPSYNPNNVKFDHFRWGDIEYAYDYTKTGEFWTEKRDIQGVISSDKKHGDLAAYASNNKWKLPSATDFNNLMKATGEYLGYFIDDNGNKVYGVLFDPNVAEGLKGKVLDKNNNVLGSSNTGSIINAGKNLRQFVKSDFDNALFFPMAGIYSDYTGYISKPGSWGGYWTSTSDPSNNTAAAFMPQNMSNSLGVYQGFSGTTQKTSINKNNMHSIRPIYVGQ
jgi:putative lipoprotein